MAGVDAAFRTPVGNTVWVRFSKGLRNVYEQRLKEKISNAGIHAKNDSLLHSRLEPCIFSVIVNNQSSAPKPLRNLIYQWTMWRPRLWNIHFVVSIIAVWAAGFLEVIFVDDANYTREFAASIPQAYVRAKLEHCQASLHRGGRLTVCSSTL